MPIPLSSTARAPDAGGDPNSCCTGSARPPKWARFQWSTRLPNADTSRAPIAASSAGPDTRRASQPICSHDTRHCRLPPTDARSRPARRAASNPRDSQPRCGVCRLRPGDGNDGMTCLPRGKQRRRTIQAGQRLTRYRSRDNYYDTITTVATTSVIPPFTEVHYPCCRTRWTIARAAIRQASSASLSQGCSSCHLLRRLPADVTR